jgi:Transposase DDE domain
VATETELALGLVLHQPLRLTEGVMRSMVALLGVEFAIPGHTTFSRRGGGLKVLSQRVERDKPLHFLVDSTGVTIYGEGNRLDQKHGVRSRRRWHKLHLAVDADTQEIAAAGRSQSEPPQSEARVYAPLEPAFSLAYRP